MDSSNTAWQVYCGKDVTAAGGSPASQNVQNMQSCMTACNTNSVNGTCNGFTFVYSGGEPKDTDTTTAVGVCYFKSGTIVIQQEAAGAHVGVAVRVGAVGAAGTASGTVNAAPPATAAPQGAGAGAVATTSSTSTSTSAAASTTTTTTTTTTTSSTSSSTASQSSATNSQTGASGGGSSSQWSPAASCGSGGQYTDPYGAVWNVNCGQDNTGAVYDQGATTGQGIYACFKACDERPTCTGFSFAGTVSGKVDLTS